MLPFHLVYALQFLHLSLSLFFFFAILSQALSSVVEKLCKHINIYMYILESLWIFAKKNYDIFDSTCLT